MDSENNIIRIFHSQHLQEAFLENLKANIRLIKPYSQLLSANIEYNEVQFVHGLETSTQVVLLNFQFPNEITIGIDETESTITLLYRTSLLLLELDSNINEEMMKFEQQIDSMEFRIPFQIAKFYLDTNGKCLLNFSNGNEMLDKDSNQKIENSLILSGSFNPIHHGHVSMMKKGSEIFGNKFTPVYEMTAINCDKGKITNKEVLRRAWDFRKLNFNLLLTKIPWFFDKSKFCRNCIFLMGIDTFIRSVDLKYYPEGEPFLKTNFEEMKENKNKFAIFPRFNEKIQKLESIKDIKIPEYMLPSIVEIDDYRLDISSTKIRAKQEENELKL